jgi:hypothetical protein
MRAQVLVGDGTLSCGGTYVVAPGDTLSVLSLRAYGDPQLYGFIADANWDALGGNPENVRIGMELTIPCVDVSGQLVTAEQAAQIAASVDAVVAAEGPLSPEQLDTLFGPVALFPDPVLSPLLVAVTFPLDVVKAGRFVADTADLPDNERAAQAGEENWDESVRDLAAAFPDLVTRMSDHIDWTEQAGEAVIAQTDDVLEAIQRLRMTAQLNGYLVDNEAQTVQTQGDTIIIMPADPGVVYVPVYDSRVVYTTPLIGPPVYYYDNNDVWQDALVTGAIILGTAIILDEIFDDNGGSGWGGWGNDVNIDWDRGDITIDRGDINIDREINIGGGDRINIGDRVEIGGGDRVSIGDLNRPDIGSGTRPSAGTLPATGGRTGLATPEARDVARQKIESRQSAAGNIATLPATRPSASRPAATSRPTASRPAATTRQLPATRPSAPTLPRARAPSQSNAFSRPSGGALPSAAASRGRASASGGLRRR